LIKTTKPPERFGGFFIKKNKEWTIMDEPKVTIDNKDDLIKDLSDDAKA